MRLDYNTYSFSKKEWIGYLAECLGICLGINYLFYKAWWVFLVMAPVPWLFMRWEKKICMKRRRRELNYQFKDALNAFCMALRAGYSAENAVAVCVGELEKLYPEGAYILQEFQYMNAQLKVNVSVEELFLDFGRRSRVEDIENFASVFASARRSGGNLVSVIEKTAKMLGDKIEVKKEIEAAIAGKKSEQMIMSMMPFAIILYMQITSPGFLQMLYGNVFGVLTMSVCLGIYFLAFWMGRRIVDIEV